MEALTFPRSAERPDLRITPHERAYLRAENLRDFWLSRLKKQDPVARIGFGLWCHSAAELEQAIAKGDPEYWNRRGFGYWDAMARSTVVNITAGLIDAGHRANFERMRALIKRVGMRVAQYHADAVDKDYDSRIGQVAGLLSARQMAEYHHLAFAEFRIRADFYGGTWLGSVPDEAEYRIYAALYCHECDVLEAAQ